MGHEGPGEDFGAEALKKAGERQATLRGLVQGGLGVTGAM